MRLRTRALVAVVWLTAVLPAAAEQVGAASALRPQATQTIPAAQPKEISVNAPVFRNAEVKTATQGLLEITFLDQSKLSLGGDSEAVIDEFQYTGPGAPGDQVLKFSKGVFRFISGAVPKDKVKIETPTSLIGIRGTTLRTRVEEDGTTTVGCDSGQVFITSRQTGQTIILNPGEKVTIKPGGEIGPVEIGRVEGCPE